MKFVNAQYSEVITRGGGGRVAMHATPRHLNKQMVLLSPIDEEIPQPPDLRVSVLIYATSHYNSGGQIRNKFKL